MFFIKIYIKEMLYDILWYKYTDVWSVLYTCSVFFYTWKSGMSDMHNLNWLLNCVLLFYTIILFGKHIENCTDKQLNEHLIRYWYSILPLVIKNILKTECIMAEIVFQQHLHSLFWLRKYFGCER